MFQAEPLLRTSNAEPLHLKLNEQQLAYLSFLLQEIRQHSFPDTYGKALICNNLVVVLIARLCSFYTENAGNTDFSLAEIAEKAGFYDTALFTRIFKAETGMSPVSYRKTLHGQTAALSALNDPG